MCGASRACGWRRRSTAAATSVVSARAHSPRTRSSASACTSASIEPSYVLRTLGRNDELARSSIRITLVRCTTGEEVDYAADLIKRKVAKLREPSPLWEMYKDGCDLISLQWAAH